jgi:hypothetical protein
VAVVAAAAVVGVEEAEVVVVVASKTFQTRLLNRSITCSLYLKAGDKVRQM